MTPTTSRAETFDHLDPWGFGRGSGDDQSAVVERFEPIDEPVDADEAVQALPALALPLPGGDRGMRLPFTRQMAGVLGVFAAVIMAQAFYIGFSLTGEASARPDATAVAVMPPPSHAPVRVDGAVRVDTGQTVAQVFLDGALAGTTPLSRTKLSAGDHRVRVDFSSGASVERTVVVRAGETIALVLEPPPARVAPAARRAPVTRVATAVTPAVTPAAPAAGWVRVDSSFAVQVFRAGELVGSSNSERIMLPAGAHVLDLVNASLGYRVPVKVTVVAGALAPVSIDTPRVPVAINAQPWAEVLVDGRRHGDTPLANVMLPIGVHDVVLRHPELGERTQTVTVRATDANRVSVDLRR